MLARNESSEPCLAAGNKKYPSMPRNEASALRARSAYRAIASLNGMAAASRPMSSAGQNGPASKASLISESAADRIVA